MGSFTPTGARNSSYIRECMCQEAEKMWHCPEICPPPMIHDWPAKNNQKLFHTLYLRSEWKSWLKVTLRTLCRYVLRGFPRDYGLLFFPSYSKQLEENNYSFYCSRHSWRVERKRTQISRNRWVGGGFFIAMAIFLPLRDRKVHSCEKIVSLLELRILYQDRGLA